MSKEEAKALYEGKYFYEVVKDADHIKLLGPFDNIYFTNPCPNEDGYKYLQVVDGIPKQAFKDEEILVTDRKL